jgi:hypothetical protein
VLQKANIRELLLASPISTILMDAMHRFDGALPHP